MSHDPMHEIEQRVTELEIQLELKSDHVRELNDAVATQSREIAVLSQKLKELLGAGSKEGLTSPAEEPPPPHY